MGPPHRAEVVLGGVSPGERAGRGVGGGLERKTTATGPTVEQGATAACRKASLQKSCILRNIS